MPSYFLQNFLLPVLVAIIAAVVTALLSGKKWSTRNYLILIIGISAIAFFACWMVVRTSEASGPMTVAGRVVDDQNASVGQANITVLTETTTSDDSGNFSIDLKGKATPSDTVKVKVSKPGYLPYDGTTHVPTDDFEIRLHRP
jgi:hypothetical protein